MKTGVVLPIFQQTPDQALAVAGEAEAAGITGVFCYDHLWPMGRPERPALAPFPVLAAVGDSTSAVMLGTLVARVGLVPDQVLLSQFGALEAVAPGRVIAGLGTGDRLSAAENAAYGIPAATPAQRRTSLRRCAGELVARGFPVWIGGGAPRTLQVAADVGAAVNLWAVDPVGVAAQAARTEVTWAGAVVLPANPDPDPDLDPNPLRQLAMELAAAGATWMVVPWPVPLDQLAAAGAAAEATR